MNKNIISGGCSFTFGHELSDYKDSKTASTKTWAHGLSNLVEGNHCSIMFQTIRQILFW